MQPSAIRGMQPLPLSWVIITRAMQPQRLVMQAIQPTSAGQPGTSDSASTSSRGTKRSCMEQPPPSDWSVGKEGDIDPYLSESECQDLLSDSSESDSEPPQKKATFVPSEDTVRLLKSLVNKPLKNDKQRPRQTNFHCHHVIQLIHQNWTCLIPKSNRFMSKLQQFCMDGMGPLISRTSGSTRMDLRILTHLRPW